MIIPESIVEKQKYLSNVVDFAKNWDWIYTSRLTHVLIEKVIENNEKFISSVGCLPLEKLDRVFRGETEGVNKDLSEFLKSCNKFTLDIPVVELPCETDEKRREKHLNPKKLHEVNCLGHFVSQIIKKHDLTTIIDIGSGLGYIDREVSSKFPECTLVAVEADPRKCSKAAELNASHKKITQICTRLDSGNVQELSKCLLDTEKINRACLIALHACGDLTVNCFRLLEACKDIQHSVLVTCCYHKVSHGNFPLSKVYKDCNDLFPTTFLRLASDRTRANFVNCSSSKFDQHVFNNLARAVIELFLHNRGLQIRKKKRKWVRKGETTDWDLYLSDWIDRHEVFSSEADSVCTDQDWLKKQLTEIWLLNTSKFNCMKGLLILQICFQSVAESFVLMDRLLYLYEKGFENSELLRITDPSISPRSVAYVVSRDPRKVL